MEQQGFLFWPHGLPLLDDTSEIEFGFSFESANPQISDFVTVLFDADGALLDRRNVIVPRSRGYRLSGRAARGILDTRRDAHRGSRSSAPTGSE